MKVVSTRLNLVCVTLIVISLMLVGASEARIDKENCVGLWLFDEGTGDVTKDSSGNGHDGKLMNDPNWVQGKFGKALEFNGLNNHVDCGDIDALDFGTNDFSISVWVKASASWAGENSNGASRIVDKNYTNGFSLMRAAGPRIQFEVGGNATVTITNKNVLDDNWHHIVAIRYDDNKSKIYIDGSLDINGNLVGGEIGNNDHFCVAWDWPFNTRAIKGTIDEVAMFNIVLADDDIKDIVAKGLGVTLGLTAVSSEGRLTAAWGAIKTQ